MHFVNSMDFQCQLAVGPRLRRLSSSELALDWRQHIDFFEQVEISRIRHYSVFET